MTQTHHAIVIGGGIGGPAVSLFLQRAGIASRIFEAHPEPATIGGGFQIAPNGMQVMAALGLADRVAAAGSTSSVFCFKNHHGRVIGRADLSRSGFGVTIRRADFHRILLDGAARAGLAIEYGKRVAAIEDSGNRVVAHFEDGTTASGDMLVAADGVGSRVRGLILPQYARQQYTGMLGIGGFVAPGSVLPSDPRDAHQLNFVVGPRLQFGYATLSTRPLVWGWWCHLPQEKELARRDLHAISHDDLRARVLQSFHGWHAPVEAFVTATEEIMRTAIYDIPPLPTWHVGRVMLLGDAAHAMSPAGGQGASLALEDAMVLGQRFTRPATSIDAVFAEVEECLRSRAERMVAEARQNDVRQLKELGRFGQWMRDRLFPVFMPFVTRQLERHYMSVPAAAMS